MRKSLSFIDSSLDDLKMFPADMISEIGYQPTGIRLARKRFKELVRSVSNENSEV